MREQAWIWMVMGCLAGMLAGGCGTYDEDRTWTPPKLPAKKTWGAPETFEEKGYRRLVKHIPRLDYDRGDRWPILCWGGGPGPGPKLQALIDRGVSFFYNGTNSVKGAEKALPALKYLHEKGVPVVILPQGHLQVMFKEPKKGKGWPPGSDHKKPARSHKEDRAFTCPAWMWQNPHLEKHGAGMEKICRFLKEEGVELAGLFIDFETGVYLRNGQGRPETLTKAMEEAWKCPRCVERFGKDGMDTLREYRALCQDGRAYATKITTVDPVKAVFPAAKVGNYFAWPISRYVNDAGFIPESAYDVPGGKFSAYGYAGSGMDCPQPRCYFTPGWRGWGNPEDVSDQATVDWNVFYYCIDRFSRCAKVLKEGEMLVPWVGWLWRGKPEDLNEKGLKVVSPEAYREMAIHTLLRGAETIAIFAPGSFERDFPEGYPVDRPEMGKVLRNIVDIQAGYNEVLRFHRILREGRPLNLECDGAYGRLDRTANVWSGYATDSVALVRTVAFGPEETKTVRIFGKRVNLPFRKTGEWYWVFPDGTITTVDR